jgi:hypothetical protein
MAQTSMNSKVLNRNNKEQKIMSKTTTKTGGIVPVSGQYKPIGSKTEVTFVQGNRVPPTPNGATKFTMVDQTKHSGGK